MKNLKTLGMAGGLITAALVGGTLMSVVSAAPSGSNGSTAPAAVDVDAARYCELWQSTFADDLGVSVDALVPAAKAATIATIDAAVEAGDLTADVAARMKTGIEKADGNGCRLLGAAFHGWGRHATKVQLGIDLFGAAATALDMTKAELFAALRSGDSLQEIATAQGKDYAAVSQAVHDAAKANLDELVAAGKLTQERADAFLAKLDEALADGRLGFPHRHFRGGPGKDAPADAPTS